MRNRAVSYRRPAPKEFAFVPTRSLPFDVNPSSTFLCLIAIARWRENVSLLGLRHPTRGTFPTTTIKRRGNKEEEALLESSVLWSTKKQQPESTLLDSATKGLNRRTTGTIPFFLRRLHALPLRRTPLSPCVPSVEAGGGGLINKLIKRQSGNR